MNEAELRHIHSVAVTAVQLSAELILDALERPRSVSHKGRTDLVTETDKKSEENIISIIQAEFPHHEIFAEESGASLHRSDIVWVIDPLDGTTNFVHGYPSFGVSIGVIYKDEPVIGVVMELPSKHLYTAIKGHGAFCDQISISVSKENDLEKSLLVTGFGYEHNENWHRNMNLFKSFTDVTQGVRRLGAASVDLCHVAKGYVDGFWEYDLHPWDTAAGIIIVKEAGGCVSTMNGEPYSIYENTILATNGVLHQNMKDRIAAELSQP